MKIDAINTVNTEQLLAWGPKITSGLLVVLIAYILADFVLLFMGAESETAQSAPQAAIQNRQPTVQSIRYAREIAALHLFGQAKGKTVDSMEDLPDTPLNLKLKGILAVGEKEGLAIIEGGGRKQEVYSIGEKLPGNATLKAVYGDRVVLESSRGLETLRLPKEKSLIEFEEEETESQSSDEDGPNGSESLADYRKQYMSNPASLYELAKNFQPLTGEGGQFLGYKVGGEMQNPVFDQVGLESEDVIVEINGIKLNRPENGMRALQRLRRDSKVMITVLRNGQETKIAHELN